MNDEVEVVIYNSNNEPVSKTLHYSIESYIQYASGSSDSKLVDLVECMIKYGNDAKAYVNATS